MNQKVTFKLEGDPIEYGLEYDFNALCEAESTSGCNLMQAIAGGQITATQTRGILLACLKKAHPSVLLSEAGDLLSKDLTTVLKALGSVLDGARTSDEEESPEETPAQEQQAA